MEKNYRLVYLYGVSLRKDAQLGKLITILQGQIKLGAEIKVVLIHDGVIGISKVGKAPSPLKKLVHLPISIYALIPDIKARGIDIKTIREKINLLNYDELVDILVDTPKIISWL